jgi:hypothetical protein
MKTKTALVFGIALGVVGIVSSAHATTTVTLDKFTGTQAFGSFSGSATINCPGSTPANPITGNIFVSGFLSGANQVFKQPGSHPAISNGASVDLFYQNTCTNQFSFLDGGVANAFTPPNPTLNSAQILGSGFVQDFDTGAQFAVSFDVVFQGSGAIQRNQTVSVSKNGTGAGGPTTINVSHFANASRNAAASGTFSIGGVNVPIDFSFSLMLSNDNSSLSVNR